MRSPRQQYSPGIRHGRAAAIVIFGGVARMGVRQRLFSIGHAGRL